MENYNEEINISGEGEAPEFIQRLHIFRNDYGYRIWDRKLKINLYKSIIREKVKLALEQLKSDPDLSKLPSTSEEVSEPKIMMFDEKHGTACYDVGTLEKLHSASLLVVTNRASEGECWYSEPKEDNVEASLGFTKEDIEKFPSGKIKEFAIKQIEIIEKSKNDYKERKRDWDLLQRALKEKNGEFAYTFLQNRKDYQYEDFKIITPGFR